MFVVLVGVWVTISLTRIIISRVPCAVWIVVCSCIKLIILCSMDTAALPVFKRWWHAVSNLGKDDSCDGDRGGMMLDLFLGTCLFGVFLILRSLAWRGVWECVAWLLFGAVVLGVIVVLLHQRPGRLVCFEGVMRWR